MEQKKHYLTVGNVIGETVNLYLSNLILFWLPFFIVVLPVELVLEYFKVTLFWGSAFESLISLANSAVSTLVGLYVVIGALDKYRDRTVSSKEILGKMKGLLFRYILLELLIFLGIVGGTLLLVVPGIIFSLRWTVSSAVFVEEGLGIKASMKRSRSLTEGFKGQIFVLFVLVSLLGLVIHSIFSLMSDTVTEGTRSFFSAFTAMEVNPLDMTSILYNGITSLLSPLTPLLLVVIYFNLKKEKEGFSVEELAGTFLDGNPERELQ